MKSSGYNAEFGGALGGVINAITKSGSNQYRGSAGLYFTNTALDSNGERRARVRYYPYDQYRVETGMLNPDTPYIYLSPVGDIGGPIRSDRIWFYAGVGYTSNQYNREAVFYSDPEKVLRKFDWGNWRVYPNYNVTAQLSNNLRLRVAGSQERYRTRKTAPGLQPDNSVMPDGRSSMGITTSTFDTDPEKYKDRWDRTGSDSTNDAWSGNLDWLLTTNFFINTTVGYYRTNSWTPEEFRGNQLRHSFGSSNSDAAMIKAGFPTVPAGFQQVSGYTDVKSSSGTLRDIRDRLFLNANTTWYTSWAGEHFIKAGIRFERFGNDVYYGYAEPNVTLYWGQTYAANDGRVLSGKYGYYQVNKTGTIGKVKSNNYSLWLQDSWTIKNRLTVNAGVRAETEHIPSYKKEPDAIEVDFGLADKVAPRVGFAYDVKGDGRWKAYQPVVKVPDGLRQSVAMTAKWGQTPFSWGLQATRKWGLTPFRRKSTFATDCYGSYGWFYDITKLELPIGQWGGDHWINYYWSLDTYDWKTINCDEGVTGCLGTFYEQWDARRSTNQYDPLLSEYFGREMTGVDPNLMPVRTGEFSLGLDHELNSRMSVGARYVHKWLDRTIEDVGIIYPGIGEIYIHGNPGFGMTEIMIPEFPQYKTPKATRQYNALELSLRKRLANNWSATVNYTWSKLWGNYSGLASSDEGGRTSPNVNRYFDSLYMSYDDSQQQVFGRLHTDRPHVLKVSGTYDLPWGTSLGVYGIVQSGLVMTEQFTFQRYPTYPHGRGNLGRTPIWSQLDLQVQHEFRLGGNQRLILNANIDNLFDQATWYNYYSSRQWRDTVNFPDSVYFGAPWTPEALVADARAAGSRVRDELLFGVQDSFQGERSIRLQAKWVF